MSSCKKYRYYSVRRPVGPGTYPRLDGRENVVNFDNGRVYCEQIGRDAWGYIESDIAIDYKTSLGYELLAADGSEPVMEGSDEDGKISVSVIPDLKKRYPDLKKDPFAFIDEDEPAQTEVMTEPEEQHWDPEVPVIGTGQPENPGTEKNSGRIGERQESPPDRSARLDRYEFARDEIRDRLTMEEVLERYYHTGKGNKVCCPFHDEKTPSFSYKDKIWTCFGCGEKGDVFDFTMKYFDIPFGDALRKLDSNFGFDLLDGEVALSPEKTAEVKRREEERNLEKEQRREEEEKYNSLQDRFAEIDRKIRENAPNENTPDIQVGEYTKLFKERDEIWEEISEMNSHRRSRELEKRRENAERRETGKRAGGENNLRRKEMDQSAPSKESRIENKSKGDRRMVFQVKEFNGPSEPMPNDKGNMLLGSGVMNVDGVLDISYKLSQDAEGHRHLRFPSYLNKQNEHVPMVVPHSSEVRKSFEEAALRDFDEYGVKGKRPEIKFDIALKRANIDVTRVSIPDNLSKDSKVAGYMTIQYGNDKDGKGEGFTLSSSRLIRTENDKGEQRMFVGTPTAERYTNRDGEEVYKKAYDFDRSVTGYINKLANDRYKEAAAVKAKAPEKQPDETKGVSGYKAAAAQASKSSSRGHDDTVR